MNEYNNQGIFIQQHNTRVNQEEEKLDLLSSQPIPYLKRGDSQKYVDQFISMPEKQKDQFKKEQSNHSDQNQQDQVDQEFSLQKNCNKNAASDFHNFQKHLSLCLKYSIKMPNLKENSSPVQKLALKMWRIFQKSNKNTKKHLHYLLGENNQHKITISGLKQYNLYKLYEQYGEQTMKKARILLAQETLKQIKKGQLDNYLQAKKLKDKEMLKNYIDIFVQQLNEGYLRKRLPKHRAYELLQR